MGGCWGCAPPPPPGVPALRAVRLEHSDDATPRTARAGRPAHGAGAAMLLARRPAEAGHRSAALQFAHECGGVGMDPPPPTPALVSLLPPPH